MTIDTSWLSQLDPTLAELGRRVELGLCDAETKSRKPCQRRPATGYTQCAHHILHEFRAMYAGLIRQRLPERLWGAAFAHILAADPRTLRHEQNLSDMDVPATLARRYGMPRCGGGTVKRHDAELKAHGLLADLTKAQARQAALCPGRKGKRIVMLP